MSRFDYVKYDDSAVNTQLCFKNCFEQLGAFTETMLPKGRAQSLVLTKLEEAYMWVGKAIRDGQIERDGSTPQQEQRKDGCP